jgi:hypothetical protein
MMVHGFWCQVYGLGIRDNGVRFQVSGLVYRVSGVWCTVFGFGCQVSGSGTRSLIPGFGLGEEDEHVRLAQFRVSGLGPCVQGNLAHKKTPAP